MALSLAGLLLVIGLIDHGLWSASRDQPWFPLLEYGLPALREGRWWTMITGVFVVATPWAYLATGVGLIAVGWLEWRRGSRWTAACFAIGQLAAVLVTAALLLGARTLPWPWAMHVAEQGDVGPSAGIVACVAAAVGLLSTPWSQRLWTVVLAAAALAVLFHGALTDLHGAVAVVLVLLVSRSMRVDRLRLREQRQLAFAVGIALGAIQIITSVIPTYGPFGYTAPLGAPWGSAAANIVVILLLVNALRTGRRWAWILTVGWGTLLTLIATAYVILSVLDPAPVTLRWGDVDVSLATCFLWTAFVIYLLITHRAFGARRSRRRAARGRDGAGAPSADDARAMIRAAGGGSLSWMATWNGMHYQRTSAGLIAYQDHLGVRIALADPLGAPSADESSVAEFVDAAERDSLIPCFFAAGGRTLAVMPRGWRSVIIADDTIVDLPGLEFIGKAWAPVRTALNRAAREEVVFRMTTWAAESWGVRQQIRAISEGWVGEKDLPEMKFILGTLDEAQDPEVRLALAVSPVGDVEGFLSWLPVYGADGAPHGWTLDLMRRREGGFSAVMEFLIGSSAATFRAEGAEVLSLSGAPLAHRAADDEGAIAQLLGRLSAILEPVYGFSSLHRFKQKFQPRSEPIYLLYRDEGDLGRIATALTRAFLPDASLRQFAAAGLDMIRPTRA